MQTNYRAIRDARFDITDYVVHLTRFVVESEDGTKSVLHGFDRLKKILNSGVLIPTRAHFSFSDGSSGNAIRGERKAICFTEMPLEQIPTMLEASSWAPYMGFGLAFYKVDLYEYGGRPAIYGDHNLLSRLHKDDEYLWVEYRPIRPTDTSSPNDFTHEREWRCQVVPEQHKLWNVPLDGIPILLPAECRRIAEKQSKQNRKWILGESMAPNFRIIVQDDQHVGEILRYVNSLDGGPTQNGYKQIYYQALKKAQVISLSYIKKMIGNPNQEVRRIEDLPGPLVRRSIPKPSPSKKPMKKRKFSP